MQILWKDGKEPPDAATKGTGKWKSMATYADVTTEEVGAETDLKGEEPPEPQSASKSLDEILASISKNFAEQMQRRPVKPAEEAKPREGPQPQKEAKAENPGKAVHKPKQQSEQQNQGAKAAVSTGMATRRPMSGMAGIYNLAARRRTEVETGPLTVVMGSQRVPVLMTLAGKDSLAPKLAVEIETEESQQKKAEVIPIRFPLSDKQRRADEFYQQTGVKLDEFRELFEPGWTVAGMLDPRENARRLKIGICNSWYDVELMALKVKHAVHDFLHKKRPIKD